MKQSRRVIYVEGTGKARVRVVAGVWNGMDVWRCEYFTARGTRTTAKYARTAKGKQEALAFAAGVTERWAQLSTPAVRRLSLEEIWQRYQAAEWEGLRVNTQKNYTHWWRAFMYIAGPHLPAEDMGPDTCLTVRTELAAGRGPGKRARKWSIGTLQRMFNCVKVIYRWAEEHDLITRNKVERFTFKVPSGAQPESPDDYTADEFRALLAQLPLNDGRYWRAHVALALCGWLGVRQNEALHLRWEDIDWDARTVRLRKEWQKKGKEWEAEPLVNTLLEILRAAHERQGQPATGWVLPAPRATNGQPYIINTLWRTLQAAEKRAGIAKKKGRGGHGLRRLAATAVAELTGDPMLALRAIRDVDPKQLKRYVKPPVDRLRGVLEQREDAYVMRSELLSEEEAFAGTAGTETYEAPEAGLEPATR